MPQIIYILENPAMPDYVKIGRTIKLESRIRALFKTNIPLPFQCSYACIVENAREVEQNLKRVFSGSRVHPRREFFSIAVEQAVAALEPYAIKDITPNRDFVESPEDEKALNKVRKRTANFNFRMVNIPNGAELSFSRNQAIKAEVFNKRQIKFRGQITSLSDVARKLLNRSYPVRGPGFWKYKGELLVDRKRRFEFGE